MERRNAVWSAVAICVLVLALGTLAQAQYGGGSGTPDDPYLIDTPEQMNAIGADPNDWDKHFKLTADIDLAAYTEFNLIGTFYSRRSGEGRPFTGTLDGDGHTISNLRVSREGSYEGLFRHVYEPNAAIRNLGLIQPEIYASDGSSVGALVGCLEQGTVRDCFVSGGTVGGVDRVGGLVGYAGYEATIANCYSTAVVRGGNRVGGLVGLGETVVGCYAEGIVIGSNMVGGLAGSAEAILDSYAQGTVIGHEYVGGLVGYDDHLIWGSSIANCYATALVIGASNTGGLVGRDAYPGVEYDHVVASFWDVETSRQPTSAGGTGKTTVDMQTLLIFLPWGDGDNTGVWTIDEGHDYPRLAWENRPGVAIASAAFTDLVAGTGTADDPFLIYTAAQLDFIGQSPDQWDKHYQLMADLDLAVYAGAEFHRIGDYGNSGVPFRGGFDGNGHTISNITWVSPGEDYLGLFGTVYDDDAEIRDLGLIDPVIVGNDHVGALVGILEKGTIANCHVKGGVVSGSAEIGGLVGWNCGTIRNCYSSAVVIGDRVSGGLVGNAYTGSLHNCYATGFVADGFDWNGGLTGSGTEKTILASFWDVEISGQMTSGGGMGLTTAEMLMAAPYLEAGWDFVGEVENGTEDVWWIDEGVDTPRLWWESAGAEF